MNNSDWFEEVKKAKAEADTYPDGGDNDLRHKFMLQTIDKLIAYVEELREDLDTKFIPSGIARNKLDNMRAILQTRSEVDTAPNKEATARCTGL